MSLRSRWLPTRWAKERRWPSWAADQYEVIEIEMPLQLGQLPWLGAYNSGPSVIGGHDQGKLEHQARTKYHHGALRKARNCNGIHKYGRGPSKPRRIPGCRI